MRFPVETNPFSGREMKRFGHFGVILVGGMRYPDSLRIFIVCTNHRGDKESARAGERVVYMQVIRQSHIGVYPGYGCATRGGEYAIRISGVVYEHRDPIGIRKQFMVKMLARAMKATPDEADDETFRRRITPFVAKPRRGR
jgi:hypothetical protein